MQNETAVVGLCALTDLVAGSGVGVLFDEQQIALFYCPDEDDRQVFAIGNFDPIGQANVLSRGIIGDKKGALCVASPLYKQHFCLRTGVCLEDPEVAVPVYEVGIEGDQVVLYLK
ncbi:MAG: nitrite reductase small subunit NirD [Pseudomonadota bacterium]